MAMTKPTSDQINFQNSVALPQSLTVDGTTLVVNGSTNRVGIGVAVPTTTLDVAGNINLTGTISGSTVGALASSMLPSGVILQIVVGKSETPISNYTSSTGADTGLSATITPQRSTSSILVFAFHSIRLYRTTANASNMQMQIRLHRNASGSATANWTALTINGAPSAGLDHYTTLNGVYLDPAGGTTAITYNTKVANLGGANTAVDLGASATQPMILVLAEIAA